MKIPHVRRWLAGAAIAALAAAGVRHHYAHPQMLRPGDRLVPLALSSLAGPDASIEPDGRPQVINIFATWCPPCREEMPGFARLALKLQARGVDVVGIDQQENAGAVSRFTQQFALPYPVYIDRSNITHDVLGARVIPTTIYIDARGVIRWERSGPLSEPDLRALAAAVTSAG